MPASPQRCAYHKHIRICLSLLQAGVYVNTTRTVLYVLMHFQEPTILDAGKLRPRERQWSSRPSENVHRAEVFKHQPLRPCRGVRGPGSDPAGPELSSARGARRLRVLARTGGAMER